MTSPADSIEVPSAASCAEAAAWIARLHGENRTAKVEEGFKRWLDASAEHRAAFEMANDVWAGIERLPKPSIPAFVRWPRAGLVLTVPRALAAALIIGVAAVGLVLHFRDSAIVTRVGEQRNLSLEDGTRISLNTSSSIHVRYSRTARRVDLDRGEAFFEVAKHADWPFIVTAGGRQVVARGTAFLVRRDAQKLAVTLVEGKVTVAPAGESVPLASSGAASGMPPLVRFPPLPSAAENVTLSPGQRLTFGDHGPPTIDRPALDPVTAWQRGQVILDHTPLAAAVAEMNRYSDVALTIETTEAARAEVTGIFRVGDSESFARAVAETYHLQVADRGRQIVLSGLPSGARGDADKN